MSGPSKRERNMKCSDLCRQGSVMMEYVLILAIVIVGAVTVFVPRSGNPLYEMIRAAYRQWIILIGLPIL